MIVRTPMSVAAQASIHPRVMLRRVVASLLKRSELSNCGYLFLPFDQIKLDRQEYRPCTVAIFVIASLSANVRRDRCFELQCCMGAIAWKRSLHLTCNTLLLAQINQIPHQTLRTVFLGLGYSSTL